MKLIQKMRKLVTLLAVAAILIGVPGLCSLQASAQGAVTYSVKYVPESGEWRYQSNTSTFDDKAYHRELYYLRQELKAGDLVVVYNDTAVVPALDLGSTRLGNLTITGSKALIIVYSGDIDECYLLGGASCAINAAVTNAYVYDTVLCNFNKNVNELNVYPADAMTATIGTIGTVNHLYAASRATGAVYYNLYNFQAGALSIRDGVLITPATRYNTVSSGTPVTNLTSANFDHVRYANDYPDLKAAFGYNAKALYNHYITYGLKEGRHAYAAPARITISAADFDYIRYADENADLKAAFGYDVKALYNHYITYGINENRGVYSIYDSFDYVRYANDYPDLKAAFGYDAKAPYQHYITYGMKEGRGNYSR